MRVIPVDSHRLRVLVVKEPQAQRTRDGGPVLDRVTSQTMWQVDVALMVVDDKGEAGRVEAVQLALPENGFPKGLGMGTVVVPENMVAISWSKDGRSGIMVRADSVKIVGGQAGVKQAAA
jgi:hypothetical protein